MPSYSRSVGKPALDPARMEPRVVPVQHDKPRLNDLRKVKPRRADEPALGNRPSGGKQIDPKKPALNKDYMQKRDVPVEQMTEAELSEFRWGRTKTPLPVQGDAIAYHIGRDGITLAHVRDGHIVGRPQLVASKMMLRKELNQARDRLNQAKANMTNFRFNQRALAHEKAKEFAASLQLNNPTIGEYGRDIPVFGFAPKPQQTPPGYGPWGARTASGSPATGGGPSPGAPPAAPPPNGMPPGAPPSGMPPSGGPGIPPTGGAGGSPAQRVRRAVNRRPVGGTARMSRSYPNAAPLGNTRAWWSTRSGVPSSTARSSGPLSAPGRTATPGPGITGGEGPGIHDAFGKMGSAMTGNLYSGIFDALSQGKTKFAGIEEPIIPKAKPFFDAGIIKSPDDLRALVNANFDPVAAGLSDGSDETASGPAPMDQISMDHIDEILRQAHASGADVTKKNPKGYWTDAMIRGQGELTKRHAAQRYIEKSQANGPIGRRKTGFSEATVNEWGWPRQQEPQLADDQIREVIQQARSFGVRCRYNDGKFMINYPAGGSSSAFFTSNPEQAIAMAKRMSRLMDAHASRMQEGYPDTTYERDEPAHEARVGGLQLRGRMTDPEIPDPNREFMQARDLHIERIQEVAEQEIDQLLRATARKLGFRDIVIEENEPELPMPYTTDSVVALPRVRHRWMAEDGHLPTPKRPLPPNIAGTGKDFRAKPGTNRAKKQPGPLVGSGKAMKAKPGFVG